MAETILKR